MEQKISKYEIEKKKFSKKLMIPLLIVFAIGMVFAVGYVVHSMVVSADVQEPFSSVQYAIQPDSSILCSNTGGYQSVAEQGMGGPTSTPVVDLGSFYAGQSGKICFKITNDAPVEVPYTISGVVLDNHGNHDACVNAFLQGSDSVSGSALNGDNYNAFTLQANPGAAPVSSCYMQFDVARG